MSVNGVELGRALLAALVMLGPGVLAPDVARSQTPPPQAPPPERGATSPSREEINPETRRGARPTARDSDLFSPPTSLPCPLASSNLTFRLQGVDVVGSSIDVDDARAAYARLLDTDIPVSRICEIRDRLSLILFRRGRLARVEVPEQTITGGRLRIEVTEARIVAVRVRGDIGPGQDKVEAYLDKLRGMTPFDLDTAQRYLLLANDVPRVRVSAALRPSAEGQGGIDLEVQLSRDPWNYLVAAQNTGSESLGPWSVLARVDLNSFTRFGERTTLIAYRTVPPNEQWIAQVVEEARFGSQGLVGRVSLAYGQSRPGGGLSALKLQGVSLVGTAEARYPVIRLRRYSVYASAGVDLVSQKTSFPGGDVLADDQLRVAWVRASGEFARPLGRRFNLSGEASLEGRKGFSAFGGSKAGDGGLSRIQGLPDAHLVRFDGEGHLSHRWFDLGVRSQAQWAFKPTLAYEELAVGDLTIGRGYEPAVLSGDRAISGEVKLQVRPQRIVNGVTISPFAFADASYIKNLDVGSESRVLRSAGAGLEVRLPYGVRAQVEWARPFDKPFPNAPQKPSDRILFQLLVAG